MAKAPSCASESLLDTLTEIDGGLFLSDAAEKLAEVTKACMDRRCKGALTITIALKPKKGACLEVVARATAKMPEQEAYGALLFGTADGRLQRRDPRQPELPGIAEAAEAESKGKKPALRIIHAADDEASA